MNHIRTGGKALTPLESQGTHQRQRPNATIIMEPGCLSAHSDFFTLDPGKVWVVTLSDANQSGQANFRVLRHSMTHRSPCLAENIHDEEDMFDFLRAHGFQQMKLGGKWELGPDEPILIIPLPGTYSFITDSVEHLETVTLALEEYPSSMIEYLPSAYMAGMTYRKRGSDQ